MFSRLNMLEEQLGRISDRRILISYTGPVTPVIMTEISRDIQGKLSNNLKAGRKVFSIFLELAQNIHFYSAEKVHYAKCIDSVGTIHIVETKDQYSVICSNTVKKTDMVELIRSCEVVNSLDREKLRELKRIQRKQPPGCNSKGAGIGIIQVAILSSNPIEIYEHEACSDYSFFTLSASVNR